MRHAIVVMLLMGCPSPSGNDGGAGGGSNMAMGGGTGGTGGGTGGSGGGTGAGLDPSAFCAARAAAICDTRIRCGFTLQALRPVCLSENANAFTCTYVPRVDAGAITWNAQNAKACVDGYAAQTCDEMWSYEFPAPCWELTGPAGHIGSPCDALECAEGGCNGRAFAGPSCATCQPFLPMGSPCSRVPYPLLESKCDTSNAVCRPGTDGGRQCLPILDAGEVCGSRSECGPRPCVDLSAIDGGPARCGFIPLGSPCETSSTCGPTAYCRGYRSASQLGTCASHVPMGAACSDEPGPDDGCADGGSCYFGTCGNGSAYSQPLGQGCDNKTYPQCVRSTWCRLDEDGGENGHCALRADAGEACDLQTYGPLCQTGLICTQHLCVVPLREGQECDLFGLRFCGQDMSCAQMADGGRECRRLGLDGARCDPPRYLDCSARLCVSTDGGTEGTCGPLGNAGASCQSVADCATYHCANPDGGFGPGEQCFPSCY